MWPRREHVLQLGLMPSHFSFLFLQIMHARRFGLGTLELPPAGASIVIWSSWSLSPLRSETMIVSGGVSEDVDMAAAVRWRITTRKARKALSLGDKVVDNGVRPGSCRTCRYFCLHRVTHNPEQPLDGGG